MTVHFVRNGLLINVCISCEMAISIGTYFATDVQFDPLHNICCVYDKKLPKMDAFKDILEFMERLPIQKALTNQHNVFRSHIERFWKNAKYDDENKVITSIVSLDVKDKEIIITEQLVREVLNFPDDENSPTKFPERMVKGCMLRMGYNGPLNIMSEKEKQKKRKRSGDDDDVYVPSPEQVQDVQTPPSSGGRKKSTTRKRVQSQVVRKLKIKLKPKHVQEPQHQSPPHQSPHQPQSPPLQSPQHPPSPPHILQTPPSTQPLIQTTPRSSTFKYFPHIPENINLQEVGDFSFMNDELVKKLQWKVEEVLVENKKLVDCEKKLEKRVKTVEPEHSSLLKRVEADQTEIDIMKVRIAELEEEKASRDEQNKYFELKNKELEANNARREHEDYMLRKVIEDLIGKLVEQRFKEIKLEEVSA
ncbi:hypothetical protein HanRHA438_Chr09g0375411 [Helianthus annuus]|uniref:Uncharacterized protein n=1 Tax=Helianthus annuus TaxID=4232 RepID=A0A9K3I1W7_HELAN|nr:hypothetical protein HanXRQr2_Chr09g0363811 [Helianthus annuus]KAJ0524452.1 hypothetical protein HanHA300_Chr09g0300551 [Helianthus annuus]KAJ0540651.1 hypothetical protein HanHA89_Chr09g0319201 [Helianthus annuus]KAJ0705801.1 hypothetical protein HanLR1_Chr09g0299481 [Helianthus annuus]KAJ0709938.1 hypothetical protein HanOQP8_Chr09g0306301 [Helianthus annuus]